MKQKALNDRLEQAPLMATFVRGYPFFLRDPTVSGSLIFTAERGERRDDAKKDTS
jgi:hypothetical protein